MFALLRFLVILFLLIVVDLHPCCCFGSRVDDELSPSIRATVSDMQNAMEREGGPLKYRILADFPMRFAHGDYSGCLHIVKICLTSEVTRICCKEADTFNDEESVFLDRLSRSNKTPYGEHIFRCIYRADFADLGLPHLQQQPDWLQRSRTPKYTETGFRRVLEIALLNRIDRKL